MEGGCGVGGRAGGRRVFCAGTNFCHWQNISDVIPFISDRGTPAGTRTSHIGFLITRDVTPFGLAGFPLHTWSQSYSPNFPQGICQGAYITSNICD